MTTFTLHATRLFDGHNYHDNALLSITNGRITGILDHQAEHADVVVKGLVVPGFIDLQVNGGGGVLFNNTPTLDGIKTMMAAHARYGTTAMLPTFITDNVDNMKLAADAISDAISQKVAGIVGVHFEGPHLSVAKKGTHCEDYIRPISDEEWQVLSRQDIGKILVTLAPETVSANDISKMVSMGIKVCLGHTNADYQTAQKAVKAGADGFTHLFNAMSPLQGREPGVVGCALLNDNTSCGLIVDGHHVDYATCKLAIKTKPQGKVFLVTDAMPPVGTNQTEFPLFDRTVYLAGGKLTSTTGELAGSVLDMATAVKNTHQLVGVALDEALRMASVYPANYIDSPNVSGLLTIGSAADFVVLNDDLGVQSTWISGQNVH